MLRKLMVAIVLVFVLLPTTALAQDASPTNYCTSATATQEDGLATYEINAVGSGRWARVVEYPVASPAVVVAVHDFGAGATVYQFQHVPLSAAKRYQVQMSHTSATSGFSTTGCILEPPPLDVIVEDFRASCSQNTVMLEWSVVSHINVTRFVVAKDGDEVLTVQADCPNCTSGASYMRYVFLGDPTGIYTLVVWNGDVLSDVSEYQLASCQVPTAVHLASLKAQTEPPVPTENLTLEFLGTLAGAALATWLTVNMLVRSMPNWKAKIVAIPAAIFWTVGASVLLAYPDITVSTVFLALANSLLVYFTATGGATMLAARASEPKRAMANGKEPFNKSWW